MLLGFSTKFPKDKGIISGKQTYFVEKIWACFQEELLYDFYMNAHGIDFKDRESISKLIKEKANYNIDWSIYDQYNFEKVDGKKKHTIRVDKNSRWRINEDIHFYINARTKFMFQFAPIGNIVDVEKIQITYDEKFCEAMGQEPVTMINDRILEIEEVDILSINDGFKDSHEFFNYFSKDFKGVLLHWTFTAYE